MPRTTKSEDIKDIINEFAARLESAIEARAQERVMDIMRQAFGNGAAVVASAQPATRQSAAKGAPSPARVLQGRYIGRLRQLKGDARARVQRVAKEEGVAEAIKLADKLRK